MATEAADLLCPVCGEGFRERPARCFRCETDLSRWWPLDETLRVLGEAESRAAAGAEEAAVGKRARATEKRDRRRRAKGWMVPILGLGGLMGALWLHLESTRPPAGEARGVRPSPAGEARGVRPTPAAALPVPSPKPAPAALPPPRRTVRYVVQPGDSLWRIAAALKGDARLWPELVGEGNRVDPARLRPGQELRLVLEGDPPAAREEPGRTRP